MRLMTLEIELGTLKCKALQPLAFSRALIFHLSMSLVGFVLEHDIPETLFWILIFLLGIHIQA